MGKNKLNVARNKNFWNADNGQNSYVFLSKENITEILEQNCQIRITITARHAFSGLTEIFVKEYDVVSDIQIGHFCKGKKFDITQ